MSRPLRLVPQAAQPIEFSCPLCGSVHAAYIFGTGQFRVFRCGGCALTFSKKAAARERVLRIRPNWMRLAVNRSERDHAGLLGRDRCCSHQGPILLVARPQDSLVELLRQRGLTIGVVVSEEDFGPADWGKVCEAAIVSDALMRVPDPRLALAKDSQTSGPGRAAAAERAAARWQPGPANGPQLARMAAGQPLVLHARDIEPASAVCRVSSTSGSKSSAAATRSNSVSERMRGNVGGGVMGRSAFRR